MTQMELTDEPGWKYNERIEAVDNTDPDEIRNLCLNGLRLAVKNEYMTPQEAKEYYRRWFNLDEIFDDT